MSDFNVRAATPRDAKAVAEIHVAAWQDAYKGIVSDAHLAELSVAKRQAYWKEAIQQYEPQVWVATLDDEIFGFVGFDRSRDEKTPPTTGELWAIYVAPIHWSKGVGLALWDAARDGLLEEGCNKVSIWLPLRNERALAFHEMAGFKREVKTAKTTTIGGTKVEEIRLIRDLN